MLATGTIRKMPWHLARDSPWEHFRCKVCSKAVKRLFVILIPGPVLLIQGHAGILSVSENFLLRVLAVLDPTAGTFLMNIWSWIHSPERSEFGDVGRCREGRSRKWIERSWELS